MKKWLCLLSILMITICGNVYAIEPGEDAYDNSDGVLVASTTKYYKTVINTSFGDSDIPSTLATPASVNANSTTYEITEEEYNAADGSNNNLIRGTVETEYKKMQSFIYANDTIYRYKVTLTWKNIPSTRMYDIIAIGYPASVKSSDPMVTFNYCRSSSNCYTNTGHSGYYKGTNGAGAVLDIPTGTLVSMNMSMFVDIYKNTSNTIYRQYCYGDYAHATKTISVTNANKFIVDTTGIVHNASYVTKFDDIPTADTLWQGEW